MTCIFLEVHGLAPSCLELNYGSLLLTSLGGSVSKESVYSPRDPSSILALGRSPGEGNGNPLQYSCLGNPMDRAGQATAHGVTRVRHD